MTKLYQMYEKMYQEGHSLFDYQLKNYKAATIKLNGRYGIFLDTSRIRTVAEETCIVAHELGHCETGTTHAICSPYDLIARHEYRANRWAAHEILSPEEIKKATSLGYTETWQLAEYFGLTEDFIETTIDVYKREGALT